MNGRRLRSRPPVEVVALGVVLALAGLVGVLYHAGEWSRADHRGELLLVLLVRVIAIVGAGLFLGRGWARWVAIAWMAYHVALSALHPWSELAVHARLLGVFVVVLFFNRGSRYFASGAGRLSP